MASATTKSPHILLLGGHGKVSLLLTPLLLARSWHVTSVVRNADHRKDIEQAAGSENLTKGKLNVLVDSLEEVKSEGDAKGVIEKAGGVDWVVWSAGAGGSGGPSRTFAIDRDACKHYIKASTSDPSIKKFLLVSYNTCRRKKAPWYSDEEWAAAQEINNGALKNYYAAKIESDEYLTALAHRRRQASNDEFQDIILRPSRLTEEPGTGKVSLGRTRARGEVSRANVAEVAAALLEKEGGNVRGWYDLLDGDVPVREAVDEVVRKGVDCFEGEDRERVYAVE